LPKPILPEGGVDTYNIHNSMSTTPQEKLGDVFSIRGCSVNLEKNANIHTDVQNAMEITQLQIVD
jgi:hypothetical protein